MSDKRVGSFADRDTEPYPPRATGPDDSIRDWGLERMAWAVIALALTFPVVLLIAVLV